MRRVNAYFENENHAEGVTARLQALRVENVTVEEIPEDNNNLVELFKRLVRAEDEAHTHKPQLLSFEVVDEDYAKAKKIIEDSKGRISEEEVS
ncbi:hypothetical protein [Thalassobacillus pellis]|uniref:hypothetical protein n=1 Tax=Thalassobacillus pellis TaxID=748008 RepID=UPI001961C5DB|nr:hypothetical protein [Thalassobacillus pellis]MBM7551620.1 hypothetical protein [Thalassobacillus pellis]